VAGVEDIRFILAGEGVPKDLGDEKEAESIWACLPAGPLERHNLEGVLEGIGEGVPSYRNLQRGWNTYFGRP
jgi:hypothetical protein